MSQANQPRLRKRRRRLQEDSAPIAAPAFLTRRIKPYDLLEEQELDKMEQQADQLLWEFGMEIRGDEGALALFKEAGAMVEGERVRFDKGLIKDIVQRSTPKTFTHVARNPEKSVEIGGNNTVFVPAYGSPFVRDLEKGRRYGTLEDFENLIKLACVNPNLHHSGGTICEPCDIPVNKRHLDMVYSHIKYSDKPFLGSITAVDRAEESIAMAQLAFGAEFMEKNCVIMGNINVNSPLVYDGIVTQVIRTYARHNQGIVICPFILGGAMGPVTPAAAIAQAHAEAMVGVALTQLERPGAPAIYGNFFTTMSLRSGAPTFGQPEAMLAYLAVGQLARRVGVPLRCGGAFTSSKVCDSQAAQESAQSLLPALLSGANFVLHAAGWLEGGLTMGYEKMLIDADRCGQMMKMFQGLAIDDNGFALDAYRETNIGEHFLGTAHTMANYSSAFFESGTADCNSFEQWQDDGSKTEEQRAFDLWQRQLKQYEAPALDIAVDESLQEYVAKQKASRNDMWY